MTTAYALGTFSKGDEPSWPGVVRNRQVAPLSRLVPQAPSTLGELFAKWPEWEAQLDLGLGVAGNGGWIAEAELRMHLPHLPENLFGAGANYRRHVIELIVDKGAGGLENLDREARLVEATRIMDERAASGTPFVWVASRSAIAGSHEPLVLPFDVTEPDWELELAVVIGKPARRVPRAEALSYVAGYTIANDITARELVERPDLRQLGMDWLACKNSPGFKILGPYITPARFIADPQKLHIRLSLNGQVMQDEGTDDMIFDVARLIEFTSSFVQLHPGDVIMTGSPSGNGTHYNRFLRDGDVMTGEIDGLVGVQVTPCLAELSDASRKFETAK